MKFAKWNVRQIIGTIIKWMEHAICKSLKQISRLVITLMHYAYAATSIRLSAELVWIFNALVRYMVSRFLKPLQDRSAQKFKVSTWFCWEIDDVSVDLGWGLPWTRLVLSNAFVINVDFVNFKQKEALKSFGQTYLEIPLHEISMNYFVGRCVR